MSGLSGSRKCHVVKEQSEEFEFFLTADDERKGQIITSVTKGGPANRGGLKDGDRILEINGNNVENKNHSEIVALIRECIPNNEIRFRVVDKESDPNAVKVEKPARQSSKVEPRPRLCKIKKKNNSFGFFLERDSKGDMINKITKGGAADGTGLKQGDRLIAVGKKNVENMQHRQIVELIKSSGNKISLLVIDEQGYEHCKSNNIPITEKMVRGSSSTTRSSSSSSTKEKSVKKNSTKSKQQSTKSRSNPNGGKVRIIHMLKHPTDGYGFYLKAKSTIPGEYVGKIDPDSSAEMAGLFEDDRVVAVNGKSIMDINHSDVISLIKRKQSQVVVVVLDKQAMIHFEEKEGYPGDDDIVRTCNPAVRTVKLTKGDGGYGMFLKVEKVSNFHVLTDVDENGVAGKAGLKSGEVVLAVNGKGVLKDDHAACVQKIKESGDSVELTVASNATSEFVKKSSVEVTIEFVKEWPTEEELSVPSFGKSTKPVVEAAAAVTAVYAEVKKKDKELGMKPRLCRVVRGDSGYGFILKEGQGHFLVSITDGSPAFKAGILEYDRIVEINGENVDKLKHSELVGKIKASGNEVAFLVVNKEEDTFFKEKGIVISSALLDVKDELSDDHKPRLCKLVKKPAGYGFHLAGEPGREGQFIKEVQKDSAAEEGGLRNGDKIIEVNGENVVGEGHDAIVKRVTSKKDEVTFLVIDKEGETYYKLKGIKIVAALVVAKEVVETKAESVHEEEKNEELQSLGEASAASSVVEATVHQDPVGDDVLETVVTAAAVAEIADKVDDLRNDDDSSSRGDARSTEEDIKILDEDSDDKREEVLEEIAEKAAVAAVAVHVLDAEDKSDEEREPSIHEDEKSLDEKISDAEEMVENVQDAVADEISDREEEDLLDAKKVAAASVAAAAMIAHEDDSESQKSSRPSTPAQHAEETVTHEEEPKTVEEIVQERVEERQEEEERDLKKIAVAGAVVAHEISDRMSERDDDSDKEEEKKKSEDDVNAAARAQAALIHQEILVKSTVKEPEEPKIVEPERRVVEEPKPEPVAVVIKPTSPPPPPAVVETPTERPIVAPAAVVLTANGDIPKSKPFSPPPTSNEPKVIWGQRNLKPITKQISVGSAASSKDARDEEPGPMKFSTVAALKAELERRNRQHQASVVKNNAKDELAELSKGSASKHIAMFGGSAKKSPQANGPKKNQWVGEGMTIKIIET